MGAKQDDPVTVRVLPRDLRPGHVTEVWVPGDLRVNAHWDWRVIRKIEKRPGNRASETPARYRVWYENVPGHRLIAPRHLVTVTAESYYRKGKEPGS